jgi:diguanylate cyclase (GGDEF)-like protein
VPRSRWRSWQTRWSLVRLAVPVMLVSLILYKGGSPSAPVALVYLPIVVGAAVLGWVQAAIIGTGAVLLYIAPAIGDLAARNEAAVRGVALAGVSALLTVATRRLVSALSRALREHRAAVVAEHRHARRFRGLEAIGRLLATAGPTAGALRGVVSELVDAFGYRHVSVFLLEGDVMRIRAYRGYEQVIEQFDSSTGVMGRVMRTRESAFIRDVRNDPDYVVVDPSMRSLICAPMLVEGELLGALNVESPHELTRTDHDILRAVASRLGAAIALGRERQALAERVHLLEQLRSLAASTAAAVDPERLYETIARIACDVLRGGGAALLVREDGSTALAVRSVVGTAPPGLENGGRREPGLVERAVESRQPAADPDGEPGPRRIAIPLSSGAEVVGALVVTQDPSAPHTAPMANEAVALLASHAALAIANQLLYRRTAEQAIRDPLTGLHNRRYFDAAFAQMLAARRRHFRRLALILFDLDRFGEFNKQYGHQLGDEVLRTFAGVLRTRVRQADLVARFGGEEFVIVLPEATVDDARTVADEIRTLFRARPVEAPGGRLTATVSAGCAEATVGDEPEDVLRRADVALYMAKRAGRDQVVAA